MSDQSLPDLGEIPSPSPRVLIITHHPVQHFSPAFEELAQYPDLNVLVAYGETPREFFDPGFGRSVAWDVELLEGYDHANLDSGRRRGLSRRLVQMLRRDRPDVAVVFGWGSSLERLALFWLRVLRVPVLLYGDSTSQHSNVEHRSWLRRRILRLLISHAAGALSTGTFNAEFYELFGLPGNRVFPSCYPIDTARFGASYLTNARAPTSTPRPSDALRIGYVGKFVPRKGTDDLIRSLALLPSTIECDLAGDGPEAESLQRLTEELDLGSRVRFLGFVNQSALPGLIATFDLLVVPSLKDFRVLVASEAMCAGTPVVVSTGTAVWGDGDIVRDGETGFVFRAGSPEDLAAAIRRFLRMSIAERDAMRERAHLVGMTQSPARFAKSLHSAVGVTLERAAT